MVHFDEPARLRASRTGNVPNSHHWGSSQWQFYRWAYFRDVEMVDAEIGRVLQALAESGELSDTLVVFTSDHGEGLAHHQMVTKGFLYDEACRTPLIVSWRGTLEEGRRDDETLISGLDLMPTLCEYAGTEPPGQMRGLSLRGLLETGDVPERDDVVVEAYHGQGQALRSRRYKYIAFNNDPVELLFDMDADPGETRNLAGDVHYAEVLADHRERLKTWNRGLEVAPTVPEDCRWV